MPASISLPSISTDQQAGPRVQMILVLRFSTAEGTFTFSRAIPEPLVPELAATDMRRMAAVMRSSLVVFFSCRQIL